MTALYVGFLLCRTLALVFHCTYTNNCHHSYIDSTTVLSDSYCTMMMVVMVSSFACSQPQLYVDCHGCCATYVHTHFPNLFRSSMIRIFILLISSDLPTVKQFLLKQAQLKCVKFGQLMDTNDVIDTVKVLKCCSGIHSKLICSFCHCQSLPCALWVKSVVDAGV